MGLRKKKSLLEQAEGYVEAAIDQAKEFVQDTALPAISDAKDTAKEKVAELNDTEPKKKRSKFKVLLMLGAIGGVVAVISKRLKGGSGDNGGWQTSYEPAPPPSPAASVPTPPPVEAVSDPVEADPVDEAPIEEAPLEEVPEADPLTDPLPEVEKSSKKS